MKFNLGEISVTRNSIENNEKTVVVSDSASAQAITLISLVITIILLILLAGVAINLSVGENGIFNKVKQAKEQYTESIAREKLEMVLLDVIAEKQTNNEYNNGQFLDDMLKANGIEVQGDNVIIDNYIFELDRDNLGINQSLGQTQIKVTKEVQSYLGKNANDKYEAQLLIIVESNTKLQKVEITNPDGTKFEIETNQEKIAKDITVEFDEEYKLEITDKTGKKETRTIEERSQEGIRTAEELAEFRDKVNTGLTYEGKVINLLKDIDLSTVCGENVNGEEISWKSIGGQHLLFDDSYNIDINKKDLLFYFAGIFDGNYHKIKNLYINTNKYQGIALFGNNYGTIQNLILENVNIQNNYSVARDFSLTSGITVYNDGNIQNCAINSGSIRGNKTIAYKYNDFWPNTFVVGITTCNSSNGIIENCYNNAEIKGTCMKENEYYNCVYSAGICGVANGIVQNCYNSGNIIAIGGDVRTGGIIGVKFFKTKELKNFYNKGNISLEACTTNYAYGGLIGSNGEHGPVIEIKNSYSINATDYSQTIYEKGKMIRDTTKLISEEQLKGYALTLGEAYIEDGKKIDKQGNVVNNLDNNGNIIYINDGYPILKWQVTER